jgi:uncharacterized protein
VSTDALPVVIPAPPPAPAGPVAPPERVAAVDVLRGVALLGILTMNIVFFAWPIAAYFDPTAGAGASGIDTAVWVVNHVVFDQKMMSIFSMLFGAGLVLMGGRADAAGRPLAGVYYRRVFWLLVIGLAHAYLLWAGDILVAYAQCGLLLYLFHRWSPRALIITGAVALLVMVPVGFAAAWGVEFLKTTAVAAEAAETAGEPLTEFQKWVREAWNAEFRKLIDPTPDERAEARTEEIAVHRGSYPGMVARRAAELWPQHTFGFFTMWVWIAGGRMLVGMGLMKLGVFAAARPARSYTRLVALGYGVGLPLVAYDTAQLFANDFRLPALILSLFVYNHVGSIFVALGHVGVVMLVCQSGLLPRLTARLAAVGRMALTNYLMQSVICTTIFYGYGFGLYGSVSRTGLVGVVLAVWAVQLLVSPVWLAYFRFGPAEWLWRTLTYGRFQPLWREAAAA